MRYGGALFSGVRSAPLTAGAPGLMRLVIWEQQEKG